MSRHGREQTHVGQGEQGEGSEGEKESRIGGVGPDDAQPGGELAQSPFVVGRDDGQVNPQQGTHHEQVGERIDKEPLGRCYTQGAEGGDDDRADDPRAVDHRRVERDGALEVVLGNEGGQHRRPGGGVECVTDTYTERGEEQGPYRCVGGGEGGQQHRERHLQELHRHQPSATVEAVGAK